MGKEKEKAYMDTYNTLGLGSDNDDDDDDSENEDGEDSEEVEKEDDEEMAIGGNTTANKRQKIDQSAEEENDDGKEVKEKKDNNPSKKKNKTTSTKSFQDEMTKNQFGGTVCVTTTYGIPEDSDDEELRDHENEMSKKNGIDEQQRSYNSVEYYLKGVKETCGSKKRDAKHHKGLYNKGKYGAASMPGIAKGKDFKIASMALRKANSGRDFSSVNTGGGGKRGKGRHGRKK